MTSPTLSIERHYGPEGKWRWTVYQSGQVLRTGYADQVSQATAMARLSG